MEWEKPVGMTVLYYLRITKILFKSTGNDRVRYNPRYSNIGKMKYSDEIKTIIAKSK